MKLSKYGSVVRSSQSFRLVLGVILVLFFAMILFYLLMQPSINEIGLMALFLAITSFITLLLGYGIYRMGWISNSPRLRWALLATYAVSSLLTFINVWLTARLMFASSHDLLLATVLLLFAGGIAMTLGHFFSETLTKRIIILNQAAKSIANGQFDVRIEVPGRDEMAELGQTFNTMAKQLQAAAEKQKELDTLRADLIAWVSHDLQTPLASIQAIVEALADGVVEEPETSQRYLKTAQREIQSLSTLIDNLFQVAQLDAGGLQLSLEANSLSDLISDTLESFSRIASQKNIRIDGQVPKEVDPVVMDAERIGRVLSNIISNALRHTPNGGEIHVKASRSEGMVTVSITDTGEGIHQEDLPHIFDRFYRGEKSRSRKSGGAGLGLSIAKGIIEAHGGWIQVENVEVGGANFIFTLPGSQRVVDEENFNPGSPDKGDLSSSSNGIVENVKH
jgi:signal transduction histidine kinase